MNFIILLMYCIGALIWLYSIIRSKKIYYIDIVLFILSPIIVPIVIILYLILPRRIL